MKQMRWSKQDAIHANKDDFGTKSTEKLVFSLKISWFANSSLWGEVCSVR